MIPTNLSLDKTLDEMKKLIFCTTTHIKREKIKEFIKLVILIIAFLLDG